MDPLSPAARRNLRAQAHHLEPVVTVGHHGLTPPVLHEIDLALLAHELVKVRVLGDDRTAREAMLGQIAAALDCAPVQHVGKVLVLWRPNPEKAAAPAPAPAPARKPPPARRAKPAPVDAIRARRRATPTTWGSATPTSKGTGGRRGAARHAPAADAVPAPPRRRRPREG